MRRANAEREDWKASCSTRWQNRSPPLWLLGPTVAGIANRPQVNYRWRN